MKIVSFGGGVQSTALAFLTVECKSIAECEFDDKNEVIFSRLCAGGCFL